MILTMPLPNPPWQRSICLSELPGRKIAVLGGMFELGEYEKEGHEKVGIRAAEMVDQLITLGDHAKMIAECSRGIRVGQPLDHLSG